MAMMHLSSILQASVFLVVAHAQQLTHPYIPNGIHKDTDFDGDLLAILASPGGSQYTITPWSNPQLIPSACYQATQEVNLLPASIDVADIKYGDCDEPWTICRSNNITSSWDDIAKVRWYLLSTSAFPASPSHEGKPWLDTRL